MFEAFLWLFFFVCPVCVRFFSFPFGGFCSQETATGRAKVIVSPGSKRKVTKKNQSREKVAGRLTHPSSALGSFLPPAPPLPSTKSQIAGTKGTKRKSPTPRFHVGQGQKGQNSAGDYANAAGFTV